MSEIESEAVCADSRTETESAGVDKRVQNAAVDRDPDDVKRCHNLAMLYLSSLLDWVCSAAGKSPSVRLRNKDEDASCSPFPYVREHYLNVFDELLLDRPDDRVIVWAYTGREQIVAMYLLIYCQIMLIALCREMELSTILPPSPTNGYVNIFVYKDEQAQTDYFDNKTRFDDQIPKSRILFVPCSADEHQKKAAFFSSIIDRSCYRGNDSYRLGKMTIFLVKGSLTTFFESMKWKLDDFPKNVRLYEGDKKVDVTADDLWDADALKKALGCASSDVKTAKPKTSTKAVSAKKSKKPADADDSLSVSETGQTAQERGVLCTIRGKSGLVFYDVEILKACAMIDGCVSYTLLDWYRAHKTQFSSAQDVQAKITTAVQRKEVKRGYVQIKKEEIAKIPEGGYMHGLDYCTIASVETLEAITDKGGKR